MRTGVGQNDSRPLGLLRVGRAAIALGVAVLTIGCAAQPKYVAASTGTEGQIKFLYNKAGGGEQGLIKCDRADDGTLSKCRVMTITLKGE